MSVAKELLDLLACPRCGGSLAETGEHLYCAVCRLKYPVREGIPILLIDQAQPVGED